MFKRHPAAPYSMPVHFGPNYMGKNTSAHYHDVTAITVPFITDPEKLAGFLPESFRPAETGVTRVVYVCNKKIDWLAGRGYNMVGVSCDVVYSSEAEGEIEGLYTFVIWENLTDPILKGRESQGIPKVFADIPDHSVSGDVWRANASHFGNKIVDIEAKNFRAPSLEEIADLAANSTQAKNNNFCWRYIPGINTPEPALDEYTIVPFENNIKQLMIGEAEINWNHLTWEENPTQYNIVNALADLPILHYLPALLTKGDTDLVLPDRPARVLK